MTTKTSLVCGSALGALMALALASGAQAQETTTTWKGAPQFANDSLTFKVRGRVYEDVIFQDVDRAVEDASNYDYSARVTRLRTARIGIEGTWNQNFAYKAEANFKAGGAVEWEDLILEYKPNDTTSIMLGNFKTISLEALTSSRYSTFMERGPFNDITDASRFMSLQAKMNGLNWTAAAALVGDSVNDADPSATLATKKASEMMGATARLTYALVDTDTDKVHLGLDVRYREANEDSLLRYQNRNNSNYGERFVDTGASFDQDTTVIGELAVVHGPLSFQTEVASIESQAAAIGGLDGTVTTGYAFVSWFPTGEMRRYEPAKGEFNRVKILNPVTAGGPGAFELGLRYDFSDLTDYQTPTNKAGEYSAWTVGATWYPFPYVRFMANYTAAQNENFGTTVRDVDVNTMQFRAQFDW